MADVLSRKPLNQESKEWQCPRCTALNSPTNIDCRICIQPKPGRSQLSSNLEDEQKRLPEEGPVKQSFFDNMRWLVLGKPAPWQCPRCTTEMGGYYNKCSTCGFLRTDFRRKSDTSVMSDIFSLFKRPPERSRSRRGSQQQPVTSVDPDLDSGFQEDSNSGRGWKCPRCTVINVEKAKTCHLCEYPKPKWDNKKKRKQHHKPKDVHESYEVDRDLIRVTPSSIIEGIDGAPLEDENNFSLPQYPSSDTPSFIAEPSSMELVLPSHSSYSPQHHFHHSLPSPPPAPQPPTSTASTSSSQAPQQLKPQTAVLSNPNTQSWKCSVCGAFNLIFLPNQRCFVCGIGLIPSTYTPLLAGDPIDAANNRTRVHPGPPGSLVIHNHPAPQPQAGHGELVYTTQPNAIVPPVPLNSSDQDHYGRNNLSDGQQVQPPQRPTRLDQKDQRSGSGRRRRRDSSIRRSAEDPLSTPGGNATVLVKLVKHQDELKADKIYMEICQYSKKSKEPFTDPDFPPADVSLYVDVKQPVSRWRVYQWQRPEDVVDPHSSRKTKWAVLRNPGPEDIAQGVLGNCWVLSALAVIAECPKLIEDIMLTKEYSPKVGAYQVRLCKDGKWEVVVIDDCLPVYKNGELVFSKAHRKQLWVPLIEKALAKLYHSYEALNAGKILSGLSILTGLPCEKIYLKKQCPDDDGIDYDLIWVQLLSFRESKFPMGASCGGFSINEQDYLEVGLEPNHAYSILDVRQLNLGEGSRKLVRLRNPWRKYSWKGNWSDQDPIWKSSPELKAELQPLGADEGIFWIEFEDFFKYFCEVDVCKHRPDWFSTRMEGQLPAFAPSCYRLLAFDVAITTEIDISIYQPSWRGNKFRNLTDLAALVLKYPSSPSKTESSIPLPESCAIASGSQIQSIVTTSGFLDPGRYAILPLAFNHWLHHSHQEDNLPPSPPEQHSSSNSSDDAHTRKRVASENDCGIKSVPYVVALHTGREVYYRDHVSTRPGFLAESLFLLMNTNGKRSSPFPGLSLYEVSLKHACRIIIAENKDQHYHFTVTCDALSSTNVVTTRGELFTVDCIPPMHRQVILVMTQLESSQPYSIYMRIEFHKSQLNAAGGWGATHLPELPTHVEELHQPRLIS